MSANRAAGYESIWVAPAAECEACQKLNGQVVTKLCPPLHGGCKCSVRRQGDENAAGELQKQPEPLQKQPELLQKPEKGDRLKIPDTVVKHSSLGQFNDQTNRLLGGCHGQSGMKELDARGIDYTITEECPNGVRFGYVPTHKVKFKRSGTGQAWFPSSWTDEDIRLAGIQTLETGSTVPASYGTSHECWINGVNVRVNVQDDGSIDTICPSYDQEVTK